MTPDCPGKAVVGRSSDRQSRNGGMANPVYRVDHTPARHRAFRGLCGLPGRLVHPARLNPATVAQCANFIIL
jgi:hypothetical protein